MRKLISLVPLIIFLSLAIFFWRGLEINPRATSSSLVGKPAPTFLLSTLSDPKKNLTEKDFLGHLSLLQVWATWCTTCELMHPFLVELSPIESIKIYGLVYKDNAQSARDFLLKNGNPYAKVGMDTNGEAAIAWGIHGTPETYLIDQHGIIQYKHTGPLTRTVWETEMIPLIEDLHRMDDPT